MQTVSNLDAWILEGVDGRRVGEMNLWNLAHTPAMLEGGFCEPHTDAVTALHFCECSGRWQQLRQVTVQPAQY